MLHKIGLTEKTVEKRVGQQEKANNEKYTVIKTFKTVNFKWLEMAAHRYFKPQRVIKEDSKDGKTEWFLVATERLLRGMEKIAMFLHYAHGDKLVWQPGTSEQE